MRYPELKQLTDLESTVQARETAGPLSASDAEAIAAELLGAQSEAELAQVLEVVIQNEGPGGAPAAALGAELSDLIRGAMDHVRKHPDHAMAHAAGHVAGHMAGHKIGSLVKPRYPRGPAVLGVLGGVAGGQLAGKVYDLLKNRVGESELEVATGLAQLAAAAARELAVQPPAKNAKAAAIQSIFEAVRKLGMTGPVAGRLSRLQMEDSESAALSAESEGVLSESEAEALAAELLTVASEAELDRFLGDIFRSVGAFAKQGVEALGSAVKQIGQVALPVLGQVAKVALPIAGKALGSFVGGPAGGMIGGQVGQIASSLIKETQGLSDEVRDFEVAKRYVQLAASAAQELAAQGPIASSQVAAIRALSTAAKRQAASGPRAASKARWVRKGNTIIVDLG